MRRSLSLNPRRATLLWTAVGLSLLMLAAAPGSTSTAVRSGGPADASGSHPGSFLGLASQGSPVPAPGSPLVSPSGVTASGAVSGHVGPAVTSTLILSNDTLVPGYAAEKQPTDPAGIAFDSASGELFVAESDSDYVSVISVASGLPVSRIVVGEQPVAVAYDPASGELFVVDYGSNQISVISDSSDTVAATISVTLEPVAIVLDNGTGQIFVACWALNSSTGDVEVISTDSNSVVATISVGAYPSGLAYDAAMSDVFVTQWNPGYAEGTVSVISDATDSVIGTVTVGRDPYGIAFDATAGELFVANQGNCTSFLGIPLGCSGGSISVISDATDSDVRTINGVSGPAALVFDSATDAVYVVEPGTCFLTCSSGRVVVVSATNDSVTRSFRVGTGSDGIAFDPNRGTLYVPDQGPGCVSILGILIGCTEAGVSVISAATESLATTIPLATYPAAVVLDSGRGQLFVGDTGLDSVRIVSSSNGTGVANVSLPATPNALAYDNATGQVFVSTGGLGGPANVTAISDATDASVATISLHSGWEPDGLAYDSGRREMFVANNGNDTVSVISDRTDKVVANVTVGWYPTAAAYDPTLGEVFVTNEGNCLFSFCSSVSVISDSNNTVVATIPVGAYPLGIAYDSATQELYTANEFGDMTILSAPSHAVIGKVSAEYGTAQVVYDPFNGLLFFSSADNSSVGALVGGTGDVVATVPVGSESDCLAVNSVTGAVYGSNLEQGTVSFIDPGNASYPAYYAVTFEETGLRTGSEWVLDLGGFSATSNGSAVSALSLNGTFPYVVEGPTGWRVAGIPPSGNLTVSGSSVVKTLRFVRGSTESVKFVVKGLPSGHRWCVSFVGSLCATTGSLRFGDLTPGSYPYAVGTLNGTTISAKIGSHAIPLAGTITVMKGLTVVLTCVYPYSLTFKEKGLPGGESWSVTIHGLTKTSTNTTISFQEPNGTYSYRLGAVAGYKGSGSPAKATVDGAPSSVTVTFSTK